MKVDILIVGGGLVGASLACALRASRYRVALVERAAPTVAAGWDARVYAISPASRAFLEDCGIWPHLDADRLQAIARMEVRGDAGGELAFSAYDSGMDALAWIAESGRLAHELWETAKRQANLSVLCPAAPAQLQVDAQCARLTLADGRMIEAAVVVGADGGNSWVREQLGMQVVQHAYAQQGVVANFECERAHHGVAWQWFREDGVLAWLPLPGNRLSIVWSTADEHAQSLLALSPQALAERVMGAGAARLGALTSLTSAAAFPLRRFRVRQPAMARAVLIGDAAHGVHPLSGHGVNLGFQDACVLAEEWKTLPALRDPGELVVLQRYVRRRAEEVMLIGTTTDMLHRAFATSANPVWRTLRNAGMGVVGQMPLLRSFMVRYAAGLM